MTLMTLTHGGLETGGVASFPVARIESSGCSRVDGPEGGYSRWDLETSSVTRRNGWGPPDGCLKSR